MPGYGWNYMTVTNEIGSPQWTASDDCKFSSEIEMLQELGATGWDLLLVREAGKRVIYYFKRPRG